MKVLHCAAALNPAACQSSTCLGDHGRCSTTEQKEDVGWRLAAACRGDRLVWKIENERDDGIYVSFADGYKVREVTETAAEAWNACRCAKPPQSTRHLVKDM